MYFVMTLIAAIIATVLWVKFASREDLRLRVLALTYWAASIMWAVDLVIAFAKEGPAAFETGTFATMLGFLAVGMGIGIWLFVLMASKFKMRRN